jgi:saccharopine dehydrogenase-like NADP-dependent oxidoreductase
MPRNVLVLGAGMMSPPLLRYLLPRTDVRLIVGALDTRKVEPLLADHGRGRALVVDVEDEAALRPLVREADLVVSLLPASYNPRVARLAVERGISMLNTSYVAPELHEQDAAARAKGVLLLSEMGLDPGLDHMSAIRLVRQIRAQGGRVRRFLSCCGGFPAPDANDNPWGYKFSWFPRQVLLSGRNPARYLRGGEVREVPGPELFAHCWPHPVEGLGVFELYPNRDSLAYRDGYELHDVEGLLRATLRYPGWCATLKAAADLGLLDVEERDWPAGATWADLTLRLVAPGAGGGVERLARHLRLSPDSEVISRLEWAGLLSDRPLSATRAPALDLFVDRLAKLMSYRPGERDMVVLEHVAEAVFPDGRTESITSTLVATGEAWGDSAMSRCVALPLAVATRLVLDGTIDAVGVEVPLRPDIYRPVLAELGEFGLGFRERRAVRFAGPLD